MRKLLKLIDLFRCFFSFSLLAYSVFCLLSFSLFFSVPDFSWAQSQSVAAIFFDSNVNSISRESIEVINRKADALKNTPQYTITLEGYSDITGATNYNIELSKKRAQIVKDYLIDLGIDPDKIRVVGKGGTEKFATGETQDALQQNRRVNLIVDIPFVPAIELEPQEIENQEQDEPEATQEPVIDNGAEESYEVVATPIPVQPISEDTSKSIEKQIRQNASDGIIFVTPSEMQIGQTYKVEAEVSSAFIEALSKDLQDWWFENKIELILIGNTFDITTQSQDNSDLKIVGKDAPAIWKWNVIPNHDGVNSLILAVVINVKGSENEVARGEYATFQRVIEVRPDMIHSITSSYWIMGVLIVFIIAVVAWILIRKVRVD
jgi:hypothetical protein